MLSTLPTRESSRPKNWTTVILIGLIIILSLALSGLATLYYTSIINANPDVIVVNQTPNNNSTNETNHVVNIPKSTKITTKNPSSKQTDKDKKDNSGKSNDNPKPKNHST